MTLEKDGMEKIATGAGIVILGIVISKILGYLYRVIVARTGTEPYGLLSLGLAILGIIITFSLLGLETGVLRYVSFYKSKNDSSKMKSTILSALKIALPLSIIFSTITFIFAEWISITFFHNSLLKPIIQIIAISAPFDVLAIILFHINRAFQVVRYEVILKQIGENILKIVFLLIFILMGEMFLGPSLAYTLSIIVVTILILFVTLKKIFNFTKKSIAYQPMYKKIFSFSWPLVLTHFLVMIMAWVDTIMIGYFKDAQEVGIYNAAIPTAQILYMIPYAFSFLFIPVLTDLYAKKEWTSLNNLLSTTTRWIFIINMIPLVIFTSLAPEVVLTLFGKEYGMAAIPLIILSLGYFMNYLVINSTNTLIIFEKTKWIFIDLLFGTVLNIVLNLMLIPRYGSIGAASATAISFGFLGILYGIQAKRLTKVKILENTHIKILLAAILAFIVMMWIKNTFHLQKAFLTLIISTSIFCVVYGICLFIFKGLKKEDRALLEEVKVRLKKMRG